MKYMYKYSADIYSLYIFICIRSKHTFIHNIYVYISTDSYFHIQLESMYTPPAYCCINIHVYFRCIRMFKYNVYGNILRRYLLSTYMQIYATYT